MVNQVLTELNIDSLGYLNNITLCDLRAASIARKMAAAEPAEKTKLPPVVLAGGSHPGGRAV